jgi:hypothetical protein
MGVIGYVIYRGTDPVAPGDSLDISADTSYIDPGATGDTLSHYFYAVKAVDAIGKRSEASNRVGEFDLRLEMF